jgi:two-component system response regulator HupR/HoxA
MTKPVVLLVDDEPLAVHYLKLGLSIDFVIVTAESYKQAIDNIENRGDVSVVITDYIMPNKTGIDLLKYLNINHPSIHRIIITGCVDETLVEKKRLGVIHSIIEKPIDDYENLKMLLRTMLN